MRSIPLHGIGQDYVLGIQVTAVMVLHALAELEGPFGQIVVDFVALCQPRLHRSAADLVGQ